MPSILFWNIARAGGGKDSFAVENVLSDLDTLVWNLSSKPDVIVLCEALGGMSRSFGFSNKLPNGYSPVNINEWDTGYKKTTTLQYFALARNSVEAYLIEADSSRPALALWFGAVWAICLHAPSVSSSTTPQTDQMIEGFDRLDSFIRKGSVPYGKIKLILGDLNLDIRNNQKVGSIAGKLHGTSLHNWGIVDPGVATHRNGNSGIWDTTLDWALERPGTNATVTAIEPEDDDPMNWSSESSDDEFVPPFQGVKNSDHLPIVVSW